MRCHRRVAVLPVLTVVLTLSGTAGAQAQPRDTDLACPPEEVPPSGFADTDGNVHAPLIDCAAWHEVAAGTTPTTYRPADPVRRDQMATFIARTLDVAGVALSDEPPPRFSDVDPGSTHALRVNQLAELGVVGGHPDGTYRPGQLVRRDQMARFIALAVEVATGVGRVAEGNRFSDVDGNLHEEHINVLAEQGVVAGSPDGTYRPADPVRRDQMAAFVMRGLDLIVEEGQFFLSTVEFGLLTGGNVVRNGGAEATFNHGDPRAIGNVLIAVDPGNDVLCFNLNVQIGSPVTGAAIHHGGIDATGPPLLTLPVNEDGRGGDCLSADGHAADIEDDPGGHYVLVRSERHPAGAVRAQLGVPLFEFDLSWANVVAVPAEGQPQLGQGLFGVQGLGWLQLDPATRVACSNVFVVGFEGPFTDHGVHAGGMDANGPVVASYPDPEPFDFPDAPQGASQGGGCSRLDGEVADGIVRDPGAHYVSMATEEAPDGALRGQLDGVSLEVGLSWEDVVDPDGRTEAGEPEAGGLVALQFGLHSGQVCHFLVTDATGPFTSADLRTGRMGQTGPSVIALEVPDTDTGVATGCAQRQAAELADILAEGSRHHVDARTDGYPHGAVRGQLDLGSGDQAGDEAEEHTGQEPVEAAAFRPPPGR